MRLATSIFRKAAAGMAVAALSVLSACGGGGGGDGGAPIGGGGSGGIDGSGLAYGTITGFGSIFVNGIEFSTTNATVKFDDKGGSVNDLRVGMLVRVDGSIANKTAATVTVDEAIKGRVEQKLDANRWVVMGQTVQIDNSTAFDNGIVPNVGDYVHVHGLVVGDGTVAAGFIERKATLDDPPFALKGVVRGHTAGATTFSVGTLTVSAAGATITDMPAGSWNGIVVEVKGSACSGNPVCGTLTATKVEPNGPRVANVAAAEFEGFVTVVGANGFTLGSQQVVTTANTRFENGTAADIAVGAKLEAEGSIANGVLTATKVQFKDNVRLEADVASNTNGTIALIGLPAISVQGTSLAKLSGAPSIASIAAGSHLRIRGRAGANNTVFATEIDVRQSDTRVELRGPVSAIANPLLTILGTQVNTSTVNVFRDRNDVSISRTAFFGALAVGNPVKMRGTLVGGSPRWDEAELED